MAGYPPPGSPPGQPFGAPVAGTARDQARAERRQQRAGRRQARMQSKQERLAHKQARLLYHGQRRGLRRTSLLAPLLLLALGVTALLIRAGHPPLATFLSWYGRWWPLLLLFAGLFLLLEWACDFFLLTGSTPAVPRRLGAGATLLLIALALFGTGTHSVRETRNLFGNDVHLGLGEFEELLEEKHESTKTVDAAFPVGTRLSVDNPHGNITVLGSADDGQMHVVVNKQIYTESDSDASQEEPQLDPQISLSGGTLQLTIPKLVGATADLTITLPSSGAASLNAQHGAVDVSALHAPVTITADHGDVTCKDITGAVNVQMSHNGSSFTASDITGDILVRGHAQDLNLTGVHGQVSLDGEFFGNTHLEHLDGPVAFRTHRSQLTLGKLPGQVDISPESELTGSRVVGPLSLHTSSRNVSFDRVAGDVSITNSRGSVNVTSSAPLGSIDVQNRDGAVTLTVPEHTGLTLDAATHGGRIDTDLGLDPTSQNGSQTLQGTIRGGGARVTVRTSHLDIDIHQGNVEPPDEP